MPLEGDVCAVDIPDVEMSDFVDGPAAVVVRETVPKVRVSESKHCTTQSLS